MQLRLLIGLICITFCHLYETLKKRLQSKLTSERGEKIVKLFTKFIADLTEDVNIKEKEIDAATGRWEELPQTIRKRAEWAAIKKQRRIATKAFTKI